MNKIISFLIVLFISTNTMASEVSNTIKKFNKSPQVAEFSKSAYGYAVFPTIGKGGFGVGGAYGKGSVFKQGEKTGKTSMTQVTFGLQLGGQAFSQIIFFKDKVAYDEFTQGNFEFSAQASAVAITVGANAQTSTNGTSTGASAGDDSNNQQGFYQGGMAIFTLAKGGLMYEAALGGQKFTFEEVKG
jgi:lipid-binding SYLF domain-containing protein